MSIKLQKLLIFGSLFTEVTARVKPTIVLKGTKIIPAPEPEEGEQKKEDQTVKVFEQRYNVEIESTQGPFNYEQAFELDTEKPTYSQCYSDLKSKSEFKEGVDA